MLCLDARRALRGYSQNTKAPVAHISKCVIRALRTKDLFSAVSGNSDGKYGSISHHVSRMDVPPGDSCLVLRPYSISTLVVVTPIMIIDATKSIGFAKGRMLSIGYANGFLRCHGQVMLVRFDRTYAWKARISVNVMSTLHFLGEVWC